MEFHSDFETGRCHLTEQAAACHPSTTLLPRIAGAAPGVPEGVLLATVSPTQGNGCVFL